MILIHMRSFRDDQPKQRKAERKNMKEKKVGISSPWVTYYKELEALFGEDPDIKVVYYENANVVKLYVEGSEKADAITKILPKEKRFGNVTLTIEVVPANKLYGSTIDIFRKAFEGNQALSYIKTVDLFDHPINYVVFTNRVVQFFNDDIGDVNGFKSTLYQDIAKDIFDDCSEVFFCTDTELNLGKPLGEWP